MKVSIPIQINPYQQEPIHYAIIQITSLQKLVEQVSDQLENQHNQAAQKLNQPEIGDSELFHQPRLQPIRSIFIHQMQLRDQNSSYASQLAKAYQFEIYYPSAYIRHQMDIASTYLQAQFFAVQQQIELSFQQFTQIVLDSEVQS